MAKKKKSKGTSPAVATAEPVPVSEQVTEPVVRPNNEEDDDDDLNEDEIEEESESVELLQVDVGDIVKLKQILDETVAGTLLDSVELKEDHSLDNVKLGIMTVACAFAVVAQFGPMPFPESRPLLGLCCCVYFLLSGVLQLVTTFLDRDSIMITKPLSGTADGGKPIPSKNKEMGVYGLRIRTTLPRFSEFYTVRLEFQNYEKGTEKKKDGASSSPFVIKTWSVGQFFDVEGMFDEEGLMMEVEALYNRFEAGKFDDEETEKKKYEDLITKKNQ